ncbi:MAG: hypothetical protein IH599_08045, partial [Bacteroidales bacterium]|nr:hypothetical protein [Bacteroidales bacterium]
MSIQALLRQLIVSVLILMGSGANSQVCLDTLDIGQDTALCAGQSLVLNAGGNYLDYLWSTGGTASSITVNSTGTYWCRTHIIDSTNLVVNGDFSLGNNYFSSSYGYGTGGPYGLLSLEGKYAISTNASLTHTNFSACTDHTTGTGNFMIVNGSSTVNTHIWCQSISILPNTDYIFSAWFTSVHPSNPAILNFTINNQNIGPLVSLSGTTCNWQNFFQVWNSGANTSATICITNQNTAISGNDFALDDIYFAQECTFYDTVNVEVLNYPVIDLGPDQTICRGDSVVLDATADPTSSYLWYNGSTAPSITADSTAFIWVEVANGNCSTVDSMFLEVIEYPVVDLGIDTVICDGSSLWLNAQNDSSTYLWSNGSSSAGILAGVTGTYWVGVSRGNCQVSDTINVNISVGPAANLGPDKEICMGDSVLLYPGPANRYLWNNGDTASQITVSPSSISTFIVQLFDGFGCSSSDSVSIAPIPLPEAMIYWSGDSICAGASVVLM